MPLRPEESEPQGPGGRSPPAPGSDAPPVPRRDSTTECLNRQAAILRALAPTTRFQLAVEMSEAARTLLRARLKATDLAWGNGRLRREECRILYGTL